MYPGDIVLSVATVNDEFSTKMPRVLIRAGQLLKMKMFNNAGSPEVPVVHAAIAVGGNIVIESVGEGIVATNLMDERPPRSALVYSCVRLDLSEAAAFAASQFYNDRSNNAIAGEYSCTKAMCSIVRSGAGNGNLQQRIQDSINIGSKSFCSQFVVNCYEIGLLYSSANITPPPPPVFNQRAQAMTPYELAAFCDGLNSGFRLSGFWEDGNQVTL